MAVWEVSSRRAVYGRQGAAVDDPVELYPFL